MKIDAFKDKVVVVTGASSGIGFALCKRFAYGGAKICLLDMDEKNAQGSGKGNWPIPGSIVLV